MRKPKSKINNPSRARKLRRKLSIRAKVVGTAERPRISVFKSNKHLAAQVVDDANSKTLFCVQSYGKNAVSGVKNNKEGAKKIGEALAGKLKEKKINSAVFDRSGDKYTGVLASLADSIRENGIQI